MPSGPDIMVDLNKDYYTRKIIPTKIHVKCVLGV
jgi:hypothetical protein